MLNSTTTQIYNNSTKYVEMTKTPTICQAKNGAVEFKAGVSSDAI
jgi:hypothetical protein